jgi:3-hydroxybutyryl-CoA dehydrogenase
MGAGIAQVAAQAGFAVVMRDIETRFTDKGMDTIRKSLDKLVEKGKMTAAERDATLGRIAPTTDMKAAADADLVIEAIVENLDLKRKLFKDLDAIVKGDAVFASNTSSIPITELAAATKRPRQFIGMHFMNPVPLMQLVEVIRGYETTDATTRTVLDVARAMGKTPVQCEDYPGFVSNRVLLPMLNEAMFAVHEGVAEVEAVDQIMHLGMNHPMGPLMLADFIGLDTCLAILNVLHDGFKDPKYRPCPLLVKMVQAGHLGKKTGKGFYDWTSGKPVPAA